MVVMMDTNGHQDKEMPVRLKSCFVLLAAATFLTAIAAASILGPRVLDLWDSGIVNAILHSSLPPEAKELLDKLPDKMRQDISDIYVRRLDGFLNEVYVWKFRCSPETFGAIQETNGLSIVRRDKVQEQFWQMSPRWWDPNPKADAEFAITVSGEVLIMYDPDRNVAYGWSSNEF